MSAPASDRSSTTGPPITQASPAMHSLEDALRFERLLADLSARFISLAPEEVEGAIEVGLREIVEALDLDRSTLALFRPEDGGYVVAQSWVRGGFTPSSTGNLAPRFPWAVKQILSGEGVRFSSLDDLPAEAQIDRASFERSRVRSHVTVPLKVGGQIVGGLGFVTMRREHPWPADLLVRLRLVAEIFGNALVRKNTQEKLQELLEFERLLADIAATLVALPAGAVDQAIERGLQRIATFLGLDRVTLWELGSDESGLQPTHSWSVEGTRELPSVSQHTTPWMFATIRANESLDIRRVDELPIDAAVDRAALMAVSTRSMLMAPLRVGDTVVGALSLATIHSSRDWPAEFVPRIRLVGEVLAAALRAERDRAALEHMTRVSVLGQLSASIAHQLNQPLTAILTNAETAQRMLARDPLDLVELGEICNDIVTENHRASEVIVRLRALFKRNELQLQQLNLNELIVETIDLVRTQLVMHRVALTTDLAPSLPKIEADRVQLQQVLLNLIVNAAEAMRADVGRQPLLHIQTESVDAGVRLLVIDNGPGVPAAQPQRVFDAFWSTKPGGMGIGLGLSRSIVAAHGGSLTAENNVDGGATFCAVLPYTNEHR